MFASCILLTWFVCRVRSWKFLRLLTVHKAAVVFVIWLHFYGSHVSTYFLYCVCATMAFETHCSSLCKVLALSFALFGLVAVGEGRFKGFRKFDVVQDSSHGAMSEELWFIQKLDHFNGADSRVWKQVSPIAVYSKMIFPRRGFNFQWNNSPVQSELQ